MDCDHSQTFNEASNKSSAIFFGEAVEMKEYEIDTTHHGKSQNWIVKFKVLKSWRLVDREYVWIETSGKNLRCGGIEAGKTYLVYANQIASSLFIHPDSRTMSLDDDLANEDLQKLGETSLTLKEGEFRDDRIQIYGLTVSLLLLLVCVIFARHFIKKRL